MVDIVIWCFLEILATILNHVANKSFDARIPDSTDLQTKTSNVHSIYFECFLVDEWVIRLYGLIPLLPKLIPIVLILA